ncbi:hypothetical protein V6N11_071932 [Hibiscus sabdariffa]|uniref:ELMO domain-containing protein n=1 Tax=Hibiscus sabdariffa TaxID=183260 RepID=A0ABR2U255_9ROSI
MWFGSWRRKLPSGDADNENHETTGLNDLNEPLLSHHSSDGKHAEGHRSKEISDEERRRADLQWEMLFSNLIMQWTHSIDCRSYNLAMLESRHKYAYAVAVTISTGFLPLPTSSVHVTKIPLIKSAVGEDNCVYRRKRNLYPQREFMKTENHYVLEAIYPGSSIVRQLDVHIIACIHDYLAFYCKQNVVGQAHSLLSSLLYFVFSCKWWELNSSSVTDSSILAVPANIVHGSGTSIVHLFRVHFNIQNGPNQKPVAPVLSPLQKERLKKLQKRLQVPFDGSRLEHQDALWQLWRLAYPDRELPSLKSEHWKDMGWQGTDPSTDFRGGGFITLENLIFFAKTYPESFQSLLHKKDGDRADWEYPFAVAGINISFMLVQMLNLRSGKPSCLAGIRFLQLLGEEETAFDNLFCVAFQMMDAQWLLKRASYLDFNDVLKSTRKQLKRELELDGVSRVKDLPAFNMLRNREAEEVGEPSKAKGKGIMLEEGRMRLWLWLLVILHGNTPTHDLRELNVYAAI